MHGLVSLMVFALWKMWWARIGDRDVMSYGPTYVVADAATPIVTSLRVRPSDIRMGFAHLSLVIGSPGLGSVGR